MSLKCCSTDNFALIQITFRILSAKLHNFLKQTTAEAWKIILRGFSYRSSILYSRSFPIEIDLMELKMKSKYVEEYSDPKKMDITVLKATK